MTGIHLIHLDHIYLDYFDFVGYYSLVLIHLNHSPDPQEQPFHYTPPQLIVAENVGMVTGKTGQEVVLIIAPLPCGCYIVTP
jgi:hypothetical protein